MKPKTKAPKVRQEDEATEGSKPKFKLPPIPSTLGACADKLYSLKAQIKEASEVVERLDAYRKAITQHLLDNLPVADAEGVVGKLARATVEKKKIPVVKDWDKLYAYITKTKSFDLLERRPSRAAFKARWEEGQNVPGVEKFNAPGISLTKR